MNKVEKTDVFSPLNSDLYGEGQKNRIGTLHVKAQNVFAAYRPQSKNSFYRKKQIKKKKSLARTKPIQK